MAQLHVVNVSPGDCTVIRHNSGRYTVMDICSGNMTSEPTTSSLTKATQISEAKPSGNFGMCNRLTNPISYLRNLGVKKIFRFILSHPDMDHMDGLDTLHSEIGFHNFWDTGYRRIKSKPTFDKDFNRYREQDWDLYEDLINGRAPAVTVLTKIAGERFSLANKVDADGKQADALSILAPNEGLLNDPDECDDVNESSYVIQYSSQAGPMILPGDAHDASWEVVMKEHPELKGNCSFLLAPHHGRDSGRSYDFLDFLKPSLTVFGCSPSEYLAYSEWSNRGLSYLTSNQAGNIVLEISDGFYDVFIENRAYAEACGCNTHETNAQKYYKWRRITR